MGELLADNAQYDVEYGLNASEASAELQKLQGQLKGLEGTLLQTQKTLENRLRTMMGSLRQSLDGIEKGTPQFTRALMNLDRRRGEILSSAGRGGYDGQKAAAATQSIISDIRNNQKQLEGRITSELISSYGKTLRNTSEAVTARIRQEGERADRLVATSQREYLAARRANLRRTIDQTVSDNANVPLQEARARAREERNTRLIGRFTPEAEAQAQLQQGIENFRIIERIKANSLRQEQRAEKTLKDEADDRLQQSVDNVQYVQRLKERAARAEISDLRRIKAEEKEAEREAYRRSPDYQNKQIIAGRRVQDRAFAARNGDAALSWQKRREVLNSNGGADLFGVQAQVMGNYAALSGVFNAARGLASFIVDLQKEFKNLQAISQATNREMDVLEGTFLKLSTTVPFTTVELAKAGTMLAQAGLTVQEIGDSLQAVATFATASGSDIASSVDVVTSAITTYNLQASQAGQVADIFTSALNLSKLSVDKLVVGMNYLGPSAAELGISLQQTVSILGALAQSGIRASTAATGARALLVDLQDPSKKFAAILKDLNLTQADVNVEANGFLPVLEKLRASGFGAAQAYEAFEVRAASAFIALSNNTEIAYEMQKALTLSGSSAAAAATQMEAFSNTATALLNSIGNAGYTAFKPLLEALTLLMSSVTEVIAVLGQMPGLLETIAVAATALGSLAFFSLMGRLFAGLTSIIPVFSGVGVAATGAAASTGLLTRAFMALTTALRLNPLTAILATIVTVTTAILALRTGTDDAAQATENLKSRAAELAGQTDAVVKKLASLDDTLENIVKQREALDANPLMREARIMEVQSLFKELGNTIDATTSSTADLVREILNIKTAQLEVQAVATKREIENKRVEVSGARGAISAYFARGADANDLRSLGRNKLISTDEMRAFGKEFRRANPNSTMEDRSKGFDDFVRGRASGIFGSDAIDRIVATLSGQQSQLGTAAQNNADIQALETARLRIQNRLDNEDLTGEEVTTLQKRIEYLDNLRGLFEQLNNKVVALEVSEQELKVLNLQDRKNTVSTTKTAEVIRRETTGLQGYIASSLGDIERGNLSPEARVDALKQLDEAIRARVLKLKELASYAIGEAQAENPALKSADIQREMNAVIDGIASKELEVVTALREGREEWFKVLEKQTKAKLKDMRSDLARLGRRRSDALTPQEVEAVAKEADALTKRMKDAVLTMFKPLAEAAKTQEEKDDVAERLREAMEEIDELIDDNAVEKVNRLRSLMQDELQRQEAKVSDEIKGLNKQIDETIAQIKTTRPGAALDALVAKFNELMGQLTGALTSSNSINFQQGVLETGSTPIPTKQADRAALAMTTLLGTKKVNKTAAAGIIGNLLVESGLDPNAKGDYRAGSPTAFGVAQWRFDRWDRQMASGPRGFDLGQQLQFVIKEMEDSFPGLIDALNGAGTEAEAARIFMERYEKPNKDPNINHVSKRMRYANSLAAGDYADQQADVAATVADKDQAVTETTRKGIVNGVNLALKSTNSAISKAMGDLKFTSTPEGVENIRKTVQDRYAQIMDEELKKFDAENAQLKTDDVDAYNAQRQAVTEKVKADLSKDMARISEEYLKAAENRIDAPVREAKTRLEVAQNPLYASKYTATDIQKLQQDVADKERIANLERIKLLTEAIAQAERDAAASPAGSAEQNDALQREIELKSRLVELTNEKAAADDALASRGPSVSSAIQAANQNYLQQQGVLDQFGKTIPLAQQVGSAWGEVLGGLQTGFESFFTDLMSGTMSAEDAFKRLGLSIVQTIMSIVAKRLATQLIGSIMGPAGDAAGGPMASLFQGLFGVPGQATGGGIPGAATGQRVTGGVPNRDSVLRKLMPGEFILNKSAADMMGNGFLTQTNNLANRRMSQSAGPLANDNEQPQGGGVVNVWVVSDRPPQMGPNDVVATISDNIQRKGAIKQLIKQVQMGAV